MVTRRALLLLLLLGQGCGARSGLLAAGQADAGGPGCDRGAAADLALPDLVPWRTPDRGRPRPDGPAPRPCALGIADAQLTLHADMVVCRSSGPWVDQCGAVRLCGPGWHLCTGSEYRKRYRQSPPATETSWLAVCVLTAGVPHAPRDQICGVCPALVTKAPQVGWGCHQDMAVLVQRTHAGVVSYPECRQVGLKKTSTAAYWSPCAPDYKLRQGFCCRD